MAFAPYADTSAADYVISYPDYIRTNSNGCFVTGVNLPDGAQLQSVTFWGASDVDGSVQGALWRSNVATGDKAFISLVVSHDTSGNRTSTVGSVPSKQMAIFNNQHFSYGLVVCLED